MVGPRVNFGKQIGSATTMGVDALKDHFEGTQYPGWVVVEWSRPTGADLEPIIEQLKVLKLTLRNVPTDPATGNCIFTGKPAVERILVARAY